MRKTKIVCTIGPASDSLEVIKEMIKAGMNVARLNFSHGTHEEHRERLLKLRQAAEELGYPLAIMLDTKGPEIRVGVLKDGKVCLREGSIVTLTTEEIEGDEKRIPVTYQGLPQAVQPGNTILLDDGMIGLKVVAVRDTEVDCEVVYGGELKSRKGVNLPGVSLDLPAVTEQDVADINFGIDHEVDFIAASFVRRAADVLAVRRLLEARDADIHIIAKIENEEGVKNLDEIIKAADGIMVARGDLGVEIATEEVPLVQKRIIEKCNQAGKPVITATQMLESMIHNPRPTRAEASDVANAIFDGTDAVMLSGETAMGKYPVEAVRVMARIAERAEKELNYRQLLLQRAATSPRTITDAISHATCTTAQDLGAAAIITSTKSGFTARMVSRYRPQAPIIAVTPSEKVCRKLCLVWGVRPLQIPQTENTDEMINEAVKTSLIEGLIRCGDLVVITAGVPAGVPGTTNLLKVHIVGEVLARGTGIGNRAVIGTVRICKSPEEAMRKVKTGDIMVTTSTDRDFIPSMRKAGAIITEEGGLTSHAAIVCLNLGIPVVVGVGGATEILEDGSTVTVDSMRGLIYRGATTVL
ncbi:MAG: Pyruvate kinase [Thermoanaerobacterales bacterium 50_218]|nr:MAG: Pyruvate kinase [Thermoanaerobacterales bacterium 50_218]HAA90068.1 pyruvate kinase [Peptococcaceae bacterium]